MEDKHKKLPLQFIVGESIAKQRPTSKFSKRFPLKNKPPEIPLRSNPDRKVSRKIIREYKHDSPVHPLLEPRTFAKTLSGGRNEWYSATSPNYVSQEAISSTQGFLHTVLHQPRVSTIDRELIIIVLEGVIANYAQRELVIRGDSISMLKDLHLRYQVVIVSGWKLARVLKILSYLANKGVYISAAYKQVSHGKGISEEFEIKRHEWYADYSRVYKDFNIQIENSKKVLCVIPLLGDYEELVPPHYIVHYTGALRPTFMVNKAPIPIMQYPFIPITIAVPHISHSPLSLMLVAELIKNLATVKNFYLAANSYKDKHFQLHSSDILTKEILALYQKKYTFELPRSLYLVMKSGHITDIITLHKEKNSQNLGYLNLLEFTLKIYN